MSKKNNNIVQVNQLVDPIIKPMNPEAVTYLSWFMSDAQNLRNWAWQIFGSDTDINSSKFVELKDASEKTLVELEDDIVKIREFLASYVPPVVK
jgi:hypothetical protein